jgi:hypothetical protein
MIDLHNAPQIITAIGGLGTAAFGLVDATKVFWGGANRIGFSKIRNTIISLTPAGGEPANALSQGDVVASLKANWYNGTDLSSQKSIAKSLVKLNLNSANAPILAQRAGVDPDVLKSVAISIASGTALTAPQTDVYARFDLILTALLDETYQYSDQTYRNGTRAFAVLFSVLLAVAGGVMLQTPGSHLYTWLDFGESLLIGLLAAPLSPIAKDLSTALATAVNTLQVVKK